MPWIEGQPLRVLVVEDNELYRRGLVRLLARHGLELAGDVETGEEAVAAVERVRPHVVLMDLHLPGMDGTEAAARIMRRPAAPRVLMLTVSSRGRDLHAALRAGAAGYLLKDAPGEEIAGAVRAAARGEAPLSAPMTAKLVASVRGLAHAPSDLDADEALSERERAVLRHVAEGLDNAAIGERLAISTHTVKTHVSAILHKLGAENRVQAATEAVRRGLV